MATEDEYSPYLSLNITIQPFLPLIYKSLLVASQSIVETLLCRLYAIVETVVQILGSRPYSPR